jgi:translation initiation factor 2 gamma subunit (eIF-2gamma)
MKLVKQDIIKGKQRLMYSCSEVGHIAQIRHLAADLHIESKFTHFILSFLGDFQIIKKLVIFMNKFHLIQTKAESTSKEEIQEFVKQNPNKILYFQDILSYT